MNIPLNFCQRCGNPRNPGEKICRFCGEPFPENKVKLDMLDQETDNHDSATTTANENEEVTEIQSNTGTADLETQADTAPGTKPADQNEDATIYSQEGNDSESHPKSAGPEESTEQTAKPADPAGIPAPDEANSPAAPPASKSSYIKIPKKGLWITLAVLLAIAVGVGITLYVLSHRNSPSATVERAFEALKKNDSEAFCAEFNLSSTTQPYVRDMAKKMMSFLGGNFKDIEIVDEQTEDMKAVVTVNIIFDDNKTEQMDLHLVKIDDQWKIEPLGDLDFGLDSLFELGKKFGFGSGSSLQDDIGNILNNLF